MAQNDQQDFLQRLLAAFPQSWLNSGDNPIIYGVLNACAYCLAYLYDMIAYVALQTRIKTATGGFLDMAAADYFGTKMQRWINESDELYRDRILKSLLQERITKRAIAKALKDLTGNEPVLYEPQSTQMGYGVSGTAGYSKAGRYGSNLVPFQGFVTVTIGVPGAPKYIAGYHTSPAGYGNVQSHFSYGKGYQIGSPIKDQSVYDTINAVKPFGIIVWVDIQRA